MKAMKTPDVAHYIDFTSLDEIARLAGIGTVVEDNGPPEEKRYCEACGYSLSALNPGATCLHEQERTTRKRRKQVGPNS